MSAAFYLQTPDGWYLHPTGGSWGPLFMVGSLDEAYAFENDEYAKEAVRCWGGPLKRVPVRWERIKPLECDICFKRATWKHKAGGFRCNKCPRPEVK